VGELAEEEGEGSAKQQEQQFELTAYLEQQWPKHFVLASLFQLDLAVMMLVLLA
jgi:hypothetical protein